MDLQERYQLDMTASMRKVRARARPWRAILALVVAVAAAIVSVRFAGDTTATGQTIRYGCAAAFFIFGMAAAFGLAGKARQGLQAIIGQAHASVLRYATVLIGLFIVLAATLDLVGVSPRQLLLGGAVTGVLLGIAAQQSLANLFAGLVLLFARPFRVGDRVRFRAGSLSGQIDGVVVDVSLTYVRLDTEDGNVLLPNSQALAAAVVMLRSPAETGGASSPVPTPAAQNGPPESATPLGPPTRGPVIQRPGTQNSAAQNSGPDAAGPAPASAGPP